MDTINEETHEVTPDPAPAPEPISLVKEEPTREEQYIRVNPGDTVESIAECYHTTVEAILERNRVNPSALSVGHWLFV